MGGRRWRPRTNDACQRNVPMYCSMDWGAPASRETGQMQLKPSPSTPALLTSGGGWLRLGAPPCRSRRLQPSSLRIARQQRKDTNCPCISGESTAYRIAFSRRDHVPSCGPRGGALTQQPDACHPSQCAYACTSLSVHVFQEAWVVPALCACLRDCTWGHWNCQHWRRRAATAGAAA